MRDAFWRCRDRKLSVFDRVHIIGILNVTPDSFSDGGLFYDREAAVKQGIQMVHDGADIIDIGGESSRPGAEPVSPTEESERVIPVIEALTKEVDVPISVDTTKAEVAKAALEAGAAIVNDISALRFDPSMAGVVASFGAGVILMHMLGEPRTMQKHPSYKDVVGEVGAALYDWAAKAEERGIDRDRIAIDPGIGFGKTKEHNLSLIKNLSELRGTHRYPVIVGPSRKTFIGLTLGLPLEEGRAGRAPLEGTAAVVAWLVTRGVQAVRVHDVKEMAGVVRMIEAVKGG